MGGAGRSAGNRLPAALIAAWTSCSAMSRLRSRLNCSVSTEAPAELADVISFSPGIWPNCRSKGAVTDDVITSGLAPGYKVWNLVGGGRDTAARGRGARGR